MKIVDRKDAILNTKAFARIDVILNINSYFTVRNTIN
jgi:hypothetical protein